MVVIMVERMVQILVVMTVGMLVDQSVVKKAVVMVHLMAVMMVAQ